MLGHLLQVRGKGWLVLALPLIAGIVLFQTFDVLNWNEDYILSISFLFSAFFIWFYDKGPHVLTYGIKNSPKSKHTLRFIEIKYWALVLGIVGCILLGRLLSK